MQSGMDNLLEWSLLDSTSSGTTYRYTMFCNISLSSNIPWLVWDISAKYITFTQQLVLPWYVTCTMLQLVQQDLWFFGIAFAQLHLCCFSSISQEQGLSLALKLLVVLKLLLISQESETVDFKTFQI
jgi:hypothetical protein